MMTYHSWQSFLMSKSFQPIVRTTTADQVLERLSKIIESGTITRGEFLPSERELSKQLGVSRVVIRETAKRLEQRGLVRIRQGIGVEVINDPSLSVEQTITRLLSKKEERLGQAAQARLLIEPELAALAACQERSSLLKQLEAANDAMLRAGTVSESVRHDISFHDTIAEIAGNAVISLMLKSIASIGRLSREVTIQKFGVAKAHRHHEAILSAIRDKDPEAARRSMERHLRAALQDLS